MIDFLAQTAVTSSASPIIWAFIFIGLALILLFVELFVPSGGLIAILGGLCVIASLIAFFVYDTDTGLIATGLYIIFGPIIAWITFKIWASSALAERMILGGVVNEDSETVRQETEARQRAQAAELEALIGQEGITLTTLRPVGAVRINGERIDAMAETGIIESNMAIVVVSAYDNQIKVRLIES